MSLPPEYLSTVFRLEDPAGPMPREFAIITAWNPGGTTLDDAANGIADEVLHRELLDLGLAPFRVTGCSPDLSHREPGWAVAVSKVEAIALGRRHRQLAIWQVRSDDLWLVDCSTGEEERVAAFSGRIRGAPPVGA
jgi:hypothetical protein